ncbi:hypothetical protein [Laspinema palackyanum]
MIIPAIAILAIAPPNPLAQLFWLTSTILTPILPFIIPKLPSL